METVTAQAGFYWAHFREPVINGPTGDFGKICARTKFGAERLTPCGLVEARTTFWRKYCRKIWWGH